MSTATRPESHANKAPVQGTPWGAIVLAVIAAAGVTSAGWYYFTKDAKAGASAAKGSSAAEAPEVPIPVAATRVSPGGIMKLCTQIGTVQPYEDADLFAKISGYLNVLKVDYGDRVKRDQLLAEIDDPEIMKDAEKAAADVLQAKAAVTQAEAFIESAKADREAASSAVDQAIAEVERYRSMTTYHSKKYARYKDLVAKQAIPQQIADEEEESLESARASEVASQKAVLNSKAQLVAAGARVKKAEADLVEAKANVDVSKAKLDKANVLMGYTKITSPYDGVITKRDFFRGAFIRSAADGGTVPLLTVARTDKVRVVTEVPDRDVPFTDVGDEVEITLDALGSEVIKGKVSRFAETEDPTSRTMHTEIDLPNPDNRLRAGMYGIAKILLDKSTKNSTLPSSCLLGESKGGKADVYVVKHGKAEKTRISVGLDDGIRVEVLSGLSKEDEVIVNTGSVTEGAPVKIDNENVKAARVEKHSPTEKAKKDDSDAETKEKPQTR